MFQTTKSKNPERTDHVWFRKPNSTEWKCCLCGAIAKTNEDPAVIVRYEKLTEQERALCPQLKPAYSL